MPAEVPHEALAGGMLAWAMADSPWAHLVDRQQFAQVLAGVRASAADPDLLLAPAGGDAGPHWNSFLQVLASVPDAEPILAPNQEEFGHMLTAMLAAR